MSDPLPCRIRCDGAGYRCDACGAHSFAATSAHWICPVQQWREQSSGWMTVRQDEGAQKEVGDE